MRMVVMMTPAPKTESTEHVLRKFQISHPWAEAKCTNHNKLFPDMKRQYPKTYPHIAKRTLEVVRVRHYPWDTHTGKIRRTRQTCGTRLKCFESVTIPGNTHTWPNARLKWSESFTIHGDTHTALIRKSSQA